MPHPARTPEGDSFRCTVCGKRSDVEYSWPAGDVICPFCGSLGWAEQSRRRQHPIPRFSTNPFERTEKSIVFRGGPPAAWPHWLRKAGVAGGTACVPAFFLLIATVLLLSAPESGLHSREMTRCLVVLVLSLGGLCLASLAAIVVGVIAAGRRA